MYTHGPAWLGSCEQKKAGDLSLYMHKHIVYCPFVYGNNIECYETLYT